MKWTYPKSYLTIVSARYGTALTGWRDVTEAVQKAVRNNKLEIMVGNWLCQGYDDAKSKVKSLIVEYSVAGRQYRTGCDEHHVLRIDANE